jgi:hypothetical protein
MKAPLHAATLLALSAALTHADTITLDATADGSYSSTGVHSDVGSTSNGGATESRAYFTFDLSGLDGDVTGATFSATISDTDLFDGVGFPAVFLSLHEVADPTALGFAALGDGAVLGTIGAIFSDEGSELSWTLNAAGLAALQASLGDAFAVGLTLDDDYASFRATWSQASLTIDTRDGGGGGNPVPEPTSLALGLLGAVGVALRRRRS